MKRFLFILLVIIAVSIPGYTRNKSVYGWNFIIGLKGGYSHILGNYQNDFSGSEYLGLYTIPYYGKYFMLELDADYSRYPLGNSPGDKLLSLSCSLGPVFYYPIIHHLHLYTGISVKGFYFHLDPTTLKGRITTYKLGLTAKGGFIIPISWGIEARLGCEYSFTTLSQKPLHSLHYFLGINFNYNVYAYTKKSEGIIPIDPEAEKRKRKEEEKNRIELTQARKEFEKAKKLISKGKYYQSIDYLKKALKRLPEAGEELKNVRKKLAPEVLRLEKAGIAVYERREFKKCIAIMKKIKYIDPNNRVMKIYLPRATKRYNALQKLR